LALFITMRIVALFIALRVLRFPHCSHRRDHPSAHPYRRTASGWEGVKPRRRAKDRHSSVAGAACGKIAP
jgi:hypothetical protein